MEITQSKPVQIITRKVGPLPIWAWVAVGAGGIFIALKLRGGGSSSSGSLPFFGSSTNAGGGGSGGGGNGGSDAPSTPTPPASTHPGEIPNPNSGRGAPPARGSGGGSSGSSGAKSFAQLLLEKARAPFLTWNEKGELIPSGHTPSTSDTYAKEYGYGHYAWEQEGQDRQQQGLDLISSLGIDFTPTVTARAGDFVPGQGTARGTRYEPILASLQGTVEYAAKRVGATDKSIAISTGSEIGNKTVAASLNRQGYTAAVVNGQVHAAKSSLTFFNSLPTEARNNLARLLQSQAKAA